VADADKCRKCITLARRITFSFQEC
jgi:hypothetical protein